MTLPALHILILAAGSSSRMRGADKLLEPVAGQPLVRHVVRMALELDLPVTVTVPPDRPLREAELQGLPVARVTVADAGCGMAASLRAGVAALPDGAAILLLLADLPEITADDLRLMHAAHLADPTAILRGTATDGTPGHPVLFPAWARPDLAGVTGDTGARDVLARYRDRLRLVALPDRHATTDLDTPEDWAAWRSGRE